MQVETRSRTEREFERNICYWVLVEGCLDRITKVTCDSQCNKKQVTSMTFVCE